MRIKELYKKYPPSALSMIPGDPSAKFEAFAPLFENLYESKIVYYEKMICVVRIEIIRMEPTGWNARAHPLTEIERVDLHKRYYAPVIPWRFGGAWECLLLSGTCLCSPYAGYRIWTDPGQVEYAERLAKEKRFAEAIHMTLHEEYAHP